MIVFLVKGDSVTTDTVKTYEIPEIVKPQGEIYSTGELVPDYYDHSTLGMLMNLPVVPISYGFGMTGVLMNKGRKPSYTCVSVNGHPVNTHPFGYFDLGVLPLHFIDRLFYGHTAVGTEFSSVDFESRINRYKRPYSLVQFAFGSFESNTYGFDLTRGITDKLGFYLSGSYHKTKGHRENADAEILSVYSNMYSNYFLPVRFDILYVNGEYGFPGSTLLPVEGRRNDEFFDVSGTTSVGKGMLTLFYERQTVDYCDTVYDRTWAVQVDHIGAMSERHDTLSGVVLDCGVNGFLTMLDGETYLPTILNRLDIWVRLEKSFGRGFVSASGKLEHASYHDIFLLPKIEVGMKTLGQAVIYAALSRDARAPSDIETWAPFDTLNPFLAVAGYDSLKPEYCWCVETGLRGRGFFLNLYRFEFSDYITVFTIGHDYYMYGNIDTWEMNGLEGYLNLPLRLYNIDSTTMTEFAFGFSGNVLFNEYSVPYFPRRSGGAIFSIRRETPRFGFGVALRAEYTSERYDYSGTEYSGCTVLSAAGFLKFMGLSCTFRLNNVLDDEYAYLPAYPMPPRNFDISFKWEFWD